jgi:hypothetical protein
MKGPPIQKPITMNFSMQSAKQTRAALRPSPFAWFILKISFRRIDFLDLTV